RAGKKKKVAKKNIKGAEPPDEIKHPLTGDSRLGGWEEDKDVSKEQIRFYHMLEDNAKKLEEEAGMIMEDALMMKDEVSETKAKDVHKSKDEIQTVIDRADETCGKQADVLRKQFMDASGDFDCGMPPPTEHAAEQCTSGNTKQKPKCSITCEKGYDGKLTRNKLRCVREGKFGEQLYGEWFGMATCAARNCGKPRKIDNSKQAKQEIKYPNIAVYICNEGFSVDGDAKGNKTFNMPCQYTGLFLLEPKAQKCEAVRCGMPHQIENGQREDREFVYTEIAQYTCDRGHTVDATAAGAGGFSVSCQATGEFTERQKCRPVLCGPAPRFKYTNLVEAAEGDLVFSNQAKYACEPGYTLTGKASGQAEYSLKCEALGDFVPVSGNFVELPECVPVSCGFAPKIANGAVSPVEIFYPDSVLAVADLGYSMSQIPNKGILMKIESQTDGTLKGVREFLPVKCGKPPEIDHAVPDNTDVQVFGDSIAFACEDGYSVDMTDNEAAKSFILDCEDTAEFSKPPSIGHCANIDDCASHTCGPFGNCVDKLLDYECSCNQGFEEIVEEGTGEKICGNIDDCGPSQCGVGECEDLVDDYNCICPDGYFEEDQPEEKMCSPVVCGLPPLKDNAATVPPTLAGIKVDFEAEPVNYNCLVGYTLTGKAGGGTTLSTECQADESFVEITDECKAVECADPPEVKNGKASAKTAKYPDVIKYECDEGHTVDGTANGDDKFSVSCLDTGELSAVLECMPVVCGVPDEAQNAFRRGNSLHYKQKVEYTCFEGFSLDGDAKGKKKYELECDKDGTFGKLENCNPVKCGNPPKKLNVRHSTIPDLGNVHFPQIVEILCDDGFTVNGSPGGDRSFNIKCQADGKFEKANKGECEPVSCGPLPLLANASLPKGIKELVYGKTATFECLDGFTSGGEWDAPKTFDVQCLPTGEFSAPSPELQCVNINECETHTCGPHGQCLDLIADYTCNCESGFEITEVGGEKVCGNKDDCGPHGCGPGVCQDLVNDYMCICPSGHYSDVVDGEKTCVPVECANKPPSLAKGELRKRSGGSFLQIENGVSVYKRRQFDSTNMHDGDVVFPETLKYKCEPGYSTDASASKARREFTCSCLSTGELTEMFKCRAVSCGAPSVLPYTMGPKDMLKSIDYGESAGYKCWDGYTIGGKPGADTEFETKCQITGKLESPKCCEPIRCGRAPRTPKARAGIAGGVYFPMEILYTCDIGHTLDGSATSGANTFSVSCGIDGKFVDPEGHLDTGCQPVVVTMGVPKVSNAVLMEAASSHVASTYGSDVAGWMAGKIITYQSVNAGHRKPRWFWPKWFLRDKAGGSATVGYCKAAGDSFPSAANADICDQGSSKQVGHIISFKLFSGAKGKWKFKSGQNYAWGWKAELDGRYLKRGKGVANFEAFVWRGAHVLTIYGASSGSEKTDGPLLSVQTPDADKMVAADKSSLMWTDTSADAKACKCINPGQGWKGSFCGIWGRSTNWWEKLPKAGMSWWKPWCYVGPDCKEAKDDTKIKGMKWAYCRRFGPAYSTPDAGNKFPLVYGQSLEYKCWPGYTLDGSQWGRTKLAAYVWPGAVLWPKPPAKCKQITYTVCGIITDARNNRGINGVEVTLNGQTRKTWWGWYRFWGVSLGKATLKVKGGGYIAADKEFEVTGNMNCWGPGAAKLSPVMAANQWRAVVTWDRKPYDLDSHTYWGSKKTLWYRRGPNWGYGMGATLEKDDTSSYGPETTFFQGTDRCRGATIHCDMAFKVYDYGRRGVLREGSGAVVTLYHGAGIAGVFKASEADKGAIDGRNNWWHVFTIDGKTNKVKYSSSAASGLFLQQKYPAVEPMNGTGYDGLGPFPRRKWKRRSQRDPALANVRRAFFQQQRAARSQQVKHNRPLNFTRRQMLMQQKRPMKNGLNSII
ncbi:MAG: hypothetical protein CMO44_16840, partial [Verrucomicrobiales bacterium]|nr:hypothetical protein [Verrucomicrobiales bacterium]